MIDAKWEAMNEQAKAKTSLVQIKISCYMTRLITFSIQKASQTAGRAFRFACLTLGLILISPLVSPWHHLHGRAFAL